MWNRPFLQLETHSVWPLGFSTIEFFMPVFPLTSQPLWIKYVPKYRATTSPTIMSSLHKLVRSEKVFFCYWHRLCGRNKLPTTVNRRATDIFSTHFSCCFVFESNRKREKIRRWLYSRSDIIFNKLHCLQFSSVLNLREWFTAYHFDFVRVFCHQCNSQFSQKNPERK